MSGGWGVIGQICLGVTVLAYFGVQGGFCLGMGSVGIMGHGCTCLTPLWLPHQDCFCDVSSY